MAELSASKQRYRPSLLIGLALALSLGAASSQAADVKKYYRYLNDEGVRVMDSSVPPRFAKNGYEVVTISGRVLEVVPPAPSPEEAEAMAAQREREAQLAEWDDYLTKRYSSIADIEAAKERKLADFDASMSILRGNLGSIQAQIEQQQARAAEAERAGRAVPQFILDKLGDLEAERVETERQIAIRAEDRQKMADKFDEDIKRFQEIRPNS